MNVAVVGCGYWGPNLIRNLNSFPQCGRLMCCDLDATKLDRIRRLYPHVATSRDFESVLKDDDIDSVVIATPVATHFELAEAALLAKKHVLIEKPMAASSAECRSLIALARKVERVLMVGHTFEYSPAVNKVREIVKRGDLGHVLYLSFARLNLGLFQSDINVMWDLAPHDLSILMYLLEKEPVAVNANGKAHFRKGIEDVGTATLHFDDGEVAFLHVSWLDPYKIRRMTVVGSDKMLVYDDVELYEKVKLFDKGVEGPRPYDTYADFHFAYRYGDIHVPRIEDQEPLKVECQHFIECVLTGATPKTDGYSGARVVRLLEAISVSMQQDGARVTLLPRADAVERSLARSRTVYEHGRAGNS